MIYNVKDGDYSKYISAVKLLNLEQPRKVYIFTFGCQQNEADSEKILGIAEAMGYKSTDTPDDADLIILNTCAIRQHAEEKALSMLGRFKALKRKNNDLIIGVCGCMAAEAHVKELLKNDFHYVTFTLEPNMLHQIPKLIHRFLTDGKRSFVIGEDKGDIAEGMPITRRYGHKAWVSIMYGCNNFCSYCIVPYVRGRERSRCAEEILSECRKLVEGGVKEITLLGQNVNSYKGEYDFAELLEKIAEIDGEFVIRFMTSHPKDVSDNLIEVMSRYSPKIAPYFHLPLQSGSNRILKLMNRTYNRDRFLSIVDKLRSRIPGICLSTDVIVGFPSETEEDFLDTLDILKRARFDMVYAFKYSAREGTPAARMEDKIDVSVKEERIDRLLKLQDSISYENNLKYVDSTVTVLVDSLSKRKDKNMVNARTFSNKLVHFEGDESMIGKYISVKIDRAGVYELYASKIDK
jgi:tRNA-2-methylthio-N6-dimethylallyladenosine synthase